MQPPGRLSFIAVTSLQPYRCFSAARRYNAAPVLVGPLGATSTREATASLFSGLPPDQKNGEAANYV